MSEAYRKCDFVAPNGLCLSPINRGKKFCDEVPLEWCYYKQLRKLNEENQKLQDGIKEINVYTTNHCTDKRALYLEKIVADCNKAEQKLNDIEKICLDCQTIDNSDELCCMCEHSNECREEEAEIPTYDIVNFILKIINKDKKVKDGKTQTTIDFLVQQLARRVEQVKRTTGKLDSVFNFDSDFCETKCCAKDKCNGNCCYEQLREMFGYEQ